MQPKQQRELDLSDFVNIAKRRARWIVFSTLAIAIVAMAAIFLLPPRYTSLALVLIERPKVPGEYVHSIVDENLGVRLTMMSETILSRTRLQPLIERFGLYANRRMTIDDKLEQLRKDIVVKPAKTALGKDLVASSREDPTPGFTIAVNSSQPRIAQQLCSEITSMFISENLKAREQSAEGTTQFLQTQLQDAKRNLDEQDAALAVFQKQYLGQLPGQEQGNQNMLATLSSQLQATTQALGRVEQEKTYAEALLAQQTAALEAAAQSGGDIPPAQRLQTQIDQLQTQLSSLEARYTPDHPDVIKARRELDALKKQMEAGDQAAAAPAPDKKSTKETPQIQQLRAQLKSMQMGIAAYKADQDRIQQQIKIFQARMQLSPEVQERFRQLTRGYETAQKFYNDLLAKKDQSAMSTELERRQAGEQFRVVDPPNLPTKPTFPNPLLFSIGGVVGGLFVGCGLAVLVEYRDRALRNEYDVFHYTKLETLASLPIIASALPPKPARRFRLRKKPAALAAAAAGGSASSAPALREAQGGPGRV
jgi:polysaccharide chain length determinant protein (PEP-CTERM system associated)